MKPAFDPSKPFEVVNEKSPKKEASKPAFKPDMPFEEVPEQEDIGTFQKILNVVDIPGSLVRTGVEAAISPDREVIPSMKSQIMKTFDSPTTAAQEAPRGADVAKAIFPEYDEESIPGKIGSVTTEMALDPLSWFSASKPVKGAIRKPLENASERQAAKALSKYAGKADVLREGTDIEAIGKRLVAEDLQGLIKSPLKLYEKISGKRHLQRINPETLDTLQIKRGERVPGLIGQASKDISSAISKVESEYGLKPVIPANIMGKQLLEKMKLGLSKTSGETPDLEGIERTLVSALKPFEKQGIPGVIGEAGDVGGYIKNPSKLSLSQIHELRKNIGKQVADRAFYATPDKAMRTETEALRDVYRELGNVVEAQLRGKQIKIGNTPVDAADYYRAQNNRLKSYLDLESMLEFQPTKALQSPDAAAIIASMMAQAGIYGGAGVGASLAGLPVNPVGAGITGAMFGAGRSAAKAVESATPEYLTSIMKSMGKVAPAIPSATKSGTMQFMREGEFVPSLETPENMEAPGPLPKGSYKPMFPNMMPKGSMITPREIINYRIPRTTQGILENKDKVVAKLVQNGVPDELIDTITQALNEDHEAVSNIAPLIISQFPTIFERSKYKVFDGQFLDPQDRAKAADDISKRDDLNSVARAKMINEINKSGKVPEGMA